MTAPFDLSDDSVVVIIGTGAGGGVLANELGQKGASLRFQGHERKAATAYGEVQGANLLDWPIDPREMDDYYTEAEDKLGVTCTNGRAGLPGDNNYKVFERATGHRATKRCTPGAWRSIRSTMMAAWRASRPAFVSRAASGGQSGRRPMATSRAAKRPAIWRCARIAM